MKARVYLAGSLESPITVGNYTIGAIRKAINDDALDYYFTPEEESDLNSTVMTAHPNPSRSGVFEISGLDANATIQVVNMMGQQVDFTISKQEGYHLWIDLSNKASSLYLLKVYTPTGIKELILLK